MEDFPQTNEAPTVQELLRDIADEFSDVDWAPARISIEQGTPYDWAVRVYFTDGKDFEGRVMTYERSS